MKPTICPLCKGEAYPIGGVGQRTHYRCQDCGTWFSRKAKRRKAIERKKERQFKQSQLTTE